MIARCQGHSSFVSSVAFDDLRCDGRTYRFGSVGEDNKLILVSLFTSLTSGHPTSRQWDFSSGALHRPKFQVSPHCSFFKGKFSQPFHLGYPSPTNVNVVISFSLLPPRSIHAISSDCQFAWDGWNSTDTVSSSPVSKRGCRNATCPCESIIYLLMMSAITLS